MFLDVTYTNSDLASKTSTVSISLDEVDLPTEEQIHQFYSSLDLEIPIAAVLLELVIYRSSSFLGEGC